MVWPKIFNPNIWTSIAAPFSFLEAHWFGKERGGIQITNLPSFVS